MIDIKLLRENPQLIKKNLEDKGYRTDIIDKIKDLDEKRNYLIHQKIEPLRQERNRIAHDLSKKRDEYWIQQGRIVKNELEDFEKDLQDLETGYNELLLQVPNLILEDVPRGFEEKPIKKVGKPKKFTFPIKNHLELGEALDIIDVQRASKISGSRFGYLKGRAVLLEFALVRFAFDILTEEGFTPIIPPVIIKKDITKKLGYWHGKLDEERSANENYYLVYDPKEEDPSENPEMYLVGTGEHSIVPMHAEETLNGDDLPKKYVAFSPCFRREAGTYGKDTRGIFRVHQFDKVEMVVFTKPEDDEKERKNLLSLSEKLLKALRLPYEVVKLGSKDLSFPSAETIDIKTWFPSENKYRETHSISTTTDFQARRLNIKYLPAGRQVKGNEKKYVHILNGTAFAIGRTIIAILENYQQKDGSIIIPKVLQKYLSFTKISKSS